MIALRRKLWACAVIVMTLTCASIASGEQNAALGVSLRVYLEKEQFIVGEPVMGFVAVENLHALDDRTDAQGEPSTVGHDARVPHAEL